LGITFLTFFINACLMEIGLNDIERQLKKRWEYPYRWFRKQNNKWDNYTNFIYKIHTWDELIPVIAELVEKEKLDKKEAFYYTVNRWYNFWSAIAVERIFCQQPGIVPAKNSKDRLVDFNIQNLSFDHKTSVFPKGFQHDFSYAKNYKPALIDWLYRNQSSEQRRHFANRLFIVVYAADHEHWKLKAEIALLHEAITKYVATFDVSKLTRVNFPENSTALSDIIWIEK
jgi:hypothetical protein